MPKKKKKARSLQSNCTRKIKSVEETSDCLTSRAGLAPFVNFLNGTKVSENLGELFAHLRKNQKGIALNDVFFQLFLFFADGTHQTLEAFNILNKNESWQKLHGCKNNLSTAALKRLLAKIKPADIAELRPLLRRVFQSALKAKNPQKVILFLDSSVYDNDGAKCRAGVKCTYKKKKGYHPINLIWDGMYIDTHFQAGDCSTNQDDVAITMLQKITPMIRQTLGEDIEIIVRMDSGYYDQKIFAACDELKIYFVCAGKHYSDHQELANKRLNDFDGTYRNKGCAWRYCNFLERRASWSEDMQYRALFLRPVEENGEALLGLDSRIILTNLDQSDYSDKQIIAYDHSRGADELTHRAAKEFTTERMPSLDFHANAFWYTIGIIAFNLFQIFKRNIANFFWNAYPNTLRRKLFDLAGKITKSSRKFKLKITRWKMSELNFKEIWQRSLIPWLLPQF